MKLRAAVRLFIATAAAIAVSFVSHSDAASQSGAVIPVLRVGITFNTSTLDPAKSEGISPFPIFERLLDLAPDGTLKPVLATKVTQPGPAVYVFQLRRGVRFWNGNEMTSADVVHSLNYERRPTSQNAGFFGPVKSITARDRYTVVVTLKQRDTSWKYVLSFVGLIFEKKFHDEHKTTMGQPGVLIQGTGAWKIDSFNPTSGAELSANPRWWGGQVPIQRMSYKFFSDEVSMALAFRGGAIDLATPVDPQAFAATSGAKLITAPARFNPGYLSLPVNNPPWNDVHVRRAVAHVLNRADIIAASGAPGTPLYSFIPPQQLRVLGSAKAVNALLKSLPQYPFSLAKAREEMAQSAYPNGFDASTDTFQYGGYVKINQVIAAALQKIGINLTVNVITASAWVSKLAGPKDKLGLEFFTDGPLPNPDPNAYPSQLLGKKNVPHGFNTAGYAPPALEGLLASGVSTQAPAKRLAIYGRVLKMLGTDLPYIPLYLTHSSLALSSKYSWPTWSGYNFGGVLPSNWAAGIKLK